MRCSANLYFIILLGLMILVPTHAQGAPDETCKGMTWRVRAQVGSYVHVGKDSQTDPRNGDTAISERLPILAIRKQGLPRPRGEDFKYSYYIGWCGGTLKLTPPVEGTSLSSLEEANRIVKKYLGDAYRMAEFHDGGGGWSFWGNGTLDKDTRFWVYINDQFANPWNSCEKTRSQGIKRRTIAPPKVLKESPAVAPANDEDLIEQVEKELGQVKQYWINNEGQVASLHLILLEEKNLDLLRRFKHLETFHIRAVRFIDLATLRALSNLTSLEIFRLQTTNLSALRHLPNLKNLSIQHSPISDISALEKLDRLEHLSLESTKVKDISVLKHLKNLKHIKISDAYVSDIRPLAHLKGLKSLSLVRTLVNDISPCAALSQLEELNLSQTRVTSIESLRNLMELKKLKLRSVRINDITPVENLVNLRELDLTKTAISHLGPIGYLKHLEDLYISSTKIREITDVAELTALTGFHMANTEIEDVSPLQNLKNLRYLNIRESRVKDIIPLRNLLNLRRFWMNKTPVTDISPLILLSKLEVVGLSGSRVAKLPFWIADWNKKFELHRILKDCPLSEPPYAVVSQGRQAIREYFKHKYPVMLSGRDEKALLDRLEILLGKKMIQRDFEDLRPNLHAYDPDSHAYVMDEENRVIGLSLSGAGIEDLSILKELKNLVYLDCSNSKVADIGPLSELKKLEELYLDQNRIKDLTPLKNLRGLKILSLQKLGIKDISALRNAKKLKELDLTYNQIADLDPLKNMKNLETLYLKKNPFGDVSALGKLGALKNLNLEDTGVTDIGPLGKLLKLKNLNLLRTGIKDVSPLKVLKDLEALHIAVEYPLDLKVISDLDKLKWLTVGQWPIETYQPLTELKSLRQLDFYMGRNLTYHMVWSIGEASKISSYTQAGYSFSKEKARSLYEKAQRIVNRYFRHDPEDRDYVPSGLRGAESVDINPQNNQELARNYRQALKELKEISQGLDAHILDYLKLPAGKELKEMKNALVPFYIFKMKFIDPWGNPYIYKKINEKQFFIASSGSDGKFEGFRKGRYIRIDGEDIVFANGTLIYGPKKE